MIIEWGIDALNPVQISAENMEPKELKEKFGEGITFWGGGCNTQEVLGVKTPEEVVENVRELVSIFKPGGGFVFNQVHNILGNVPPDSVDRYSCADPVLVGSCLRIRFVSPGQSSMYRTVSKPTPVTIREFSPRSNA